MLLLPECRFIPADKKELPSLGWELLVPLKATTGFEPVIRVLQTRALPLGYVAKTKPAGY